MSEEKRSLPLKTTFEDGALCVRIGIETLVTTIEQGPLWPRAKVVDVDTLGPALAKQIEDDEDESGLTMLMKAIDHAAERLVEDGHPSIQWNEDAEEGDL
jgi:hypothetical protein